MATRKKSRLQTSKLLHTESAVHVLGNFAPEAKPLRQHFEKRFADPRKATGDRFVWDYWHVPGQYTALRTPAFQYFPKAIYNAWHQRLVEWGRRTLGCHDVSPTWLSCYVDGGRQEFHADVPHGPWAFVFSLTPWSKRRFRGGETLILRDEVLSFWSRSLSSRGTHRGLEDADVLQEIAPEFNQLTVFDPRLPHGVRRVDGTHDPREGRLVVHGWFVQPRPFIESAKGGLTAAQFAEGLEPFHVWMGEQLGSGDVGALQGMQSYRLSIAPSGRVLGVKLLINRALALGSGEVSTAFARAIVRRLSALRFAPTKVRTRLATEATLPLVFESDV